MALFLSPTQQVVVSCSIERDKSLVLSGTVCMPFKHLIYLLGVYTQHLPLEAGNTNKR